MPKPNILFLMTDQHRWDYMGYAGHPLMTGLTPSFDGLAAEGAVFTRCYSPNPLCMPARNAIHTGLYTFQSGQMDNVGDWPMAVPTFTQALQDLGYHTALTGKIHAHEAVGYDIDLTDKEWDDEIHALGFDDVVQVAGKTMDFFTDDAYTHHLRERGLLYAYREDIVRRVESGSTGGAWPSILPEEEYIDNYVGRGAVEWVERYSGERPFFHMVSFCSPHTSFDAYRSALSTVDRTRIRLPAGNDLAPSWADRIASYAAQIHIVDLNVGRILAALESRGWLDNTLILFTADHGEMLGDGGKTGKCHWEDASCRVPMLVRFRPWTGPRVVDETCVSIHDVAATFIGLAGEAEEATAGDAAAGKSASSTDLLRRYLPGSSSRSLQPLLTGNADRVRDHAYSENGGQFGRPWRMLDSGELKYVWLRDSGEELLFRRDVDPHCVHDVASDPAMKNLLEEMRAAMLDTHLAHPAPKTGRAAYSPRVPHRITRERLGRTPSSE